MGKLIDADKLIEDFMNNYLVKNDGTWNGAIDRCVELAKTAPTAYSVEKVVKELERETKPIIGLYTAETPMMERAGYKMEYNKAIKKSIEIVNRGWKL